MIFIAIEKLHKIQPEQTKIGFYNKKLPTIIKTVYFHPHTIQSHQITINRGEKQSGIKVLLVIFIFPHY